MNEFFYQLAQFFKAFPEKDSLAYRVEMLGYEPKPDIEKPAYLRQGMYVHTGRHSHAMSDHPDDAPKVRKFIDNYGVYMQFETKPNRYLRVCVIDENKGVIGFQVVDMVGDRAKERTAYIKNSIKNIVQLIAYANTQGYSLVKEQL